MLVSVRRRTLLAMCALIALGACLDVTNPPDPDTQVRVINASGGAIDISVDGIVAISQADPAAVSLLGLTPGTHIVQFQTTSGATSSFTVTTVSGDVRESYVVSPTPTTLSSALLDTGGIVPAGKSKVRVIHLSQLAPAIDIWRTQPDFTTPTKIQTPFPYLSVTPFIQSDAGFWEVFITPAGATAPRLLTTNQFQVEATGKRTIVLMDSGGVQIFRVLPE